MAATTTRPVADKYRRTWFAVLRQAGVHDPDARHDLQESLTGKASTSDWTRRDWDQAIAHMQRRLGQHKDGHAHVCGVRPPGAARDIEAEQWPTDEQVGYIEDLCDRIAWTSGRRRGPVGLLIGRVLSAERYALRRAVLSQVADQVGATPQLWTRLYREEAQLFIVALRRYAEQYPLEESDG